jgi:hypothetical protein
MNTLPNKIPFDIRRDHIIDFPVNPRATVDIYINDFIGLAVDIEGSNNAKRIEKSPLLGLNAVSQEVADDESIPCDNMDARSKLVTETGLTKQKTILRWFVFLSDDNSPTRKEIPCLFESDISEMLQWG